MQYFERAVFERHPENEPPYDVLLSQLGTARYAARNPAAGRTDAIIVLTFEPGKMALGGGYVWVATVDGAHNGKLLRIERRIGRIVGAPGLSRMPQAHNWRRSA